MKYIKKITVFFLIFICIFLVPKKVYAETPYECPYCRTTFDLEFEDTILVYTTPDNIVHIYNEDTSYEGELFEAYICPYCEAPLIVPDNLLNKNTESSVNISLKDEYKEPSSQVTCMVENVPEGWDREMYITFYDLNTYEEFYMVLYRANNFMGRLSVPAGTYCLSSAGVIGDSAGRIGLSWDKELDTFTLTNKQVLTIKLNFSQDTLDKYNGVEIKEEELIYEKPTPSPTPEPIIEEIEEKEQPPLLLRIVFKIIPYILFFFIGLGIWFLVDKYKKNNKI